MLDSATPIGNDPLKIKKLLNKHKEFQRTLGSKQISYDGTMKSGRILKDKCPKQDIQLLQNMMDELKTRWNKVCSKSVDRSVYKHLLPHFSLILALEIHYFLFLVPGSGHQQ